MGNENQRSRDIARAALLRERILGALRAAPSPMSVQDLCDMTSIVELYSKTLLPHKVSVQLTALRKSGEVTRISRGQWAISREQRAADVAIAAAAEPLQHLQLEVSKRDKTVSFIFEGLQITVKVLP